MPDGERKPTFRLPRDDQRIAVMGRTGSGKTQFAAWLLSEASIDRMPWVIFNTKRDKLLLQIPHVEEIGLHEKVPKAPGLYMVSPTPSEDEETEAFLWKIWTKEKTGVYADEAYMIPEKGAYNALLTQGRSKRIPMINLVQRPAWVSRFVFSEADYYSVFHLIDRKDHERVRGFAPIDFSQEIPEYHSWYHDVAQHATFGLRPVPDGDTILERFEDRLKPRRRFL